MRIYNAHMAPRKKSTAPSSLARKTRKRALNVSVRAELVAEAKRLGTNISAVLEQALEDEHRRRLREQWRRENGEAIQEANLELAENGLWSSHLRTF
jgi:antitoxin CcdA